MEQVREVQLQVYNTRTRKRKSKPWVGQQFSLGTQKDTPKPNPAS